MQRYYRMDLRFEFGFIGCRRLIALFAGLPPDSAIHRDGKVWTQERELLASLVEQLDRWGGAFASLMTAKPGQKTQMPPPLAFPHPQRPGASDGPRASVKRGRRQLSVAEFQAQFESEVS